MPAWGIAPGVVRAAANPLGLKARPIGSSRAGFQPLSIQRHDDDTWGDAPGWNKADRWP